jgi:hypothetical protein
MRGMHMVPGMLDAAFDVPYDPERLSLDQYAAAVLERYYAAMLDLAATDERSLLVSYEEGFPATFLRAAGWVGRSFDPDSLRQIRERCGYHAKRPHERFGAETVPSIAGVDLAALEARFAALEQCRTRPQA